jgi:DNA-binding Lrp family transcriptional regulator
MLQDFLTRLGLTEKDRAIFIALAELGVQPASTVARRCKMDRVSTYKHLKRLAEEGYINVFSRDGIQCFGVAGTGALQAQVQDHITSYEALLKEVPLIEKVLQGMTGGGSLVPEVEIFEGKAGMKGLLRDLLFEMKQQELGVIRMLTSNTFEERPGAMTSAGFMDEFFAEVRKRKLDIEILEASGTLLPERVRRVFLHEFHPEHIAAARGATNVLLAGTVVYITCYRDSQIGLKIKQGEMSQLFHFFFDMLTKMAA